MFVGRAKQEPSIGHHAVDAGCKFSPIAEGLEKCRRRERSHARLYTMEGFSNVSQQAEYAMPGLLLKLSTVYHDERV
jgi:hypothetical protein